MTASIDTARRGVSDPLASTVDCGFELIHCAFCVIENSNTLNRGLTRRLNATSSDLLYFEHPRRQEVTIQKETPTQMYTPF